MSSRQSRSSSRSRSPVRNRSSSPRGKAPLPSEVGKPVQYEQLPYMTVAALRKVAAQMGIPGRSKVYTKDDLLEMIEENWGAMNRNIPIMPAQSQSSKVTAGRSRSRSPSRTSQSRSRSPRSRRSNKSSSMADDQYAQFTVQELRDMAKESGLKYSGLNKTDLINLLFGSSYM